VADTDQTGGVVQKVLMHMYNSVVVGSLNSIAIVLRMKMAPEAMNPRHKDLKELYDILGPNGRRLFYNATASIVEFALYRTLDFVEQYNRFDSDTNEHEFPRISLVYTDAVNGKEDQSTISTFGSQELGRAFKRTARREEVKQLVEAAISDILGSPSGNQQ
jgi:hypothetical protein